MLKQADYQGKGFALQERQRQPQEQQQQQPMPPPKAAPSTLQPSQPGTLHIDLPDADAANAVTSFIAASSSPPDTSAQSPRSGRAARPKTAGAARTASSRSSSSSVQERATKKTQHSTRVTRSQTKSHEVRAFTLEVRRSHGPPGKK